MAEGLWSSLMQLWWRSPRVCAMAVAVVGGGGGCHCVVVVVVARVAIVVVVIVILCVVMVWWVVVVALWEQHRKGTVRCPVRVVRTFFI